MKKNHDKHIRQYLTEVQTIAEQSMPRGRYLQVVNRCAKIVYEMNQRAREEAKGTGYHEEVASPAITQAEVAAARDKRTFDRERILAHLQEGRPLTTVEAIQMGILRAGARVFELRKDGYNIETRLVKSGNDRIAEYRLIQK